MKWYGKNSASRTGLQREYANYENGVTGALDNIL